MKTNLESLEIKKITLCHKKNICTEKKLKQNHKTCEEYNLTRGMQMIKILMSMRQG